jgi:CPA2 family monovalent cation:H+ antiporter-2
MGGAFLSAALLARLGSRIGLPTIPLFMLAGILLGPHTPGGAVVEHPSEFDRLSSLGLVLLLFYLGLKFHMDDLRSGGRRLWAVGSFYLALNVGAGLGFGLALGWGIREAFVLAGVLGISSSAIVTKVLIDLGRTELPETRLILGVIVIEDIFLALYLAILQPVIGRTEGLDEIAVQVATAFGFLLLLAVIARFGTRVVSRLFAIDDDELLIISFLGTVVLLAGISEVVGANVIGAFMAGLILAGTSSADRIRTLLLPLRDAFGAIFFFVVGLVIDPKELISVAGYVAAAVVLTIVMNAAAGMLAARVYGFGPRRAAELATTLLPRGEFALILGALAATAGLDAPLNPFIFGYVLVLAVLGPILAGRPHLIGRPMHVLGDALSRIRR